VKSPAATYGAAKISISLPPLTGATILSLGGNSASETLNGLGNAISGTGGYVELVGSGSLTTISLGDGADRVSLHGALNTIVLGDGDVTVHATGGGAKVRIGPDDVRVSYGDAVTVTLALAVPGFGYPGSTRSGFVDSGHSFGWFDRGTGNIGILNGLDNGAGSDGHGNIGALNGNGNGGADNGDGNIGVLNGNLNGQGNAGPGSGVGNGNVGAINGNADGNRNVGPGNGRANGNGNVGAANGNFDGNLNHGTDNGTNNGNGNLGDLNGNNNGNGASFAFASGGARSAGITLTGALDTVVVGNGDDTVSVAGGLSTIVAGNGRDAIHIGGSYDTVVAGNGSDSVDGYVDHAAIRLGDGGDHVTLGGADGDVVQTGAGDDVIRLSGWGNLVDAGASLHQDIIYSGSGGDTFVVTAVGHGLDQIYDFSTAHADVLDMRGALAAAGWGAGICGIAAELHVAVDGGNTWVGVGAGAGVMVAELVGVQASWTSLLSDHALRFS